MQQKGNASLSQHRALAYAGSSVIRRLLVCVQLLMCLLGTLYVSLWKLVNNSSAGIKFLLETYRGDHAIQFGDALQRLRRKMGLRQEDVARMVGVERTTVANWERGAKRPGLETLVKLSEIFGVSLDELVGAARTTAPLPLVCYCSLVSDPLVGLLAKRTGVPAKTIAAFIVALQIPEGIQENNGGQGVKDKSDNHDKDAR